jgi:probable O-glycosylation ligase (exosortase A-associated)
MSLRSLFVLVAVFASLPFILRSPYVGVLMWEWLGFMNPHRLTWGFTFDFPFAQIVAIATILALFASKDQKKLPWIPLVVLWLTFWLWMTITTMTALNPDGAWSEWSRFSKINLMLIVTLMVLTTRNRIEGALLIVVLSLAFYGIKGGIFTLRGGGEGTVWGPADSFIAGNNELAFALVVVLPMAWYFYLQYSRAYAWIRWGAPVAAGLCLLSILGSQSRGAFLAVAAMLAFLWVRSRKKFATGLLVAIGGIAALSFMPVDWTERMETIRNYQDDGSAMGRINAWRFAVNLANDRPIVGGGANAFTPAMFDRYAPLPDDVHDAHSIYFEVLAEQGYVGLALYLMLGILVITTCAQIIVLAKRHPQLNWAVDFGRLSQVAFVGYGVGGAFLGLAYFDLPYTLMAFVACAYVVVRREANVLVAKVAGAETPFARDAANQRVAAKAARIV